MAVAEDFGALLGSGDVLLRSADGVPAQAHACMLRIRSAQLRDMLQHTSEIALDCSAESLDGLLRFVYTGQVSTADVGTYRQVVELSRVVQSYGIAGLGAALARPEISAAIGGMVRAHVDGCACPFGLCCELLAAHDPIVDAIVVRTLPLEWGSGVVAALCSAVAVESGVLLARCQMAIRGAMKKVRPSREHVLKHDEKRMVALATLKQECNREMLARLRAQFGGRVVARAVALAASAVLDSLQVTVEDPKFHVWGLEQQNILAHISVLLTEGDTGCASPRPHAGAQAGGTASPRDAAVQTDPEATPTAPCEVPPSSSPPRGDRSPPSRRQEALLVARTQGLGAERWGRLLRVALAACLAAVLARLGGRLCRRW